MAAPKAQTLQQRFGFMDNDLKTPKHDEIMLWLDERAIDIVIELYWASTWHKETINVWDTHTRQAISKTTKNLEASLKSIAPNLEGTSVLAYWKDKQIEIENSLNLMTSWGGLGEPPTKPPIEIAGFTWEKPVVSNEKSKFIIGFIDLAIVYNDWRITVDNIEKNANEYFIKDIKRLPIWYVEYGSARQVFFEVKTEIPSLGELIRQINMYREYVSGHFVVICPDDKFKEPLKGQGIDFYKYDPNIIPFS